MKRCGQCQGKLGLGVRSRNLWNGRWWAHVRFCSTHCEARYELERYDATARRWRERILGKRGGSLNGVSQNSDMMAVGKPSADVESLRGKVSDEVFGEPFVPPVSDG